MKGFIVRNFNIVLVISVLLYFSPATILFAIIVGVPWVIGLMLFKKYSERCHE